MKNTVYFNPITPIFENRPPGCIICGSPGSGKTYFLQTIMTNCLQERCIVIALDPKNDHEGMLKVDPSIKFRDISKKESLDPFKCIENVDTNFIVSIIDTICGGLSKEAVVAITPIVSDYTKKAKSGNASFLKLMNYLYSNQNPLAQHVGTLLKSNEKSEYGPVFFNNEKTCLEIGRESSIICLFGLPLPKTPDRESWTKEEMFSSAIIMVLVKMLRNILTKVNKVPVVLFIDEAHIILANPHIYKIIEEFLILGRSLNVATILASQNVSHFPEDFSNFVSNRFQFRSSKNEVKEFLRRFLVSSEEEIDSLVSFAVNAPNGGAIMIDRKNRVGEIQISGDLGINTTPIK